MSEIIKVEIDNVVAVLIDFGHSDRIPEEFVAVRNAIICSVCCARVCGGVCVYLYCHVSPKASLDVQSGTTCPIAATLQKLHEATALVLFLVQHGGVEPSLLITTLDGLGVYHLSQHTPWLM